MRGKVGEAYSRAYIDRITPAYAGKSVYFLFLLCFIQDHPRLCGEKVNFHNFIFHKLGSPPPMRGKDFTKKGYNRLVRITPAYAGKRKQRGAEH